MNAAAKLFNRKMNRIIEPLTLWGMEEFHEFLKSKVIDPDLFKKGDPAKYLECAELFEKIHPKSLIAQKLFLINSLRRKYPFKALDHEKSPTQKSNATKPKITPKPKI
jgi:hypothetical protein